MKFISDPAIPLKIRKMKERVRWNDPVITRRHIDQTRVVLDDGHQTKQQFSFLVIGDSGTGRYRGDSPQRRVAESMLTQSEDCRFVLHTGDVVYLVGSSEQYFENFIDPYREFLVGGEQPRAIAYDKMTFKLPIFPVLGNHDYYNLPRAYGILAQLATPIRRLLRSRIDLDVGWHGSFHGDAFARAFLDYLKPFSGNQLAEHLNRHYVAPAPNGHCLRYVPEQFTRLPNRYYRFQYGGIDFFALDSNTFNVPQPLANNAAGTVQRQSLREERRELEQQRMQLMKELAGLSADPTHDHDRTAEIFAEIEQIGESILDIEKQLQAPEQASDVDVEQLNWLTQSLIESWQNPEVRGRIVFFHHPPYVTESTKWNQGQTLAIRHHLRWVLDSVKQEVGSIAGDRPLINLVLNGHAHCLEYLHTTDTGHADANLNWVVCGSSGYSLRRQREEGAEIMERFVQDGKTSYRLVAKSQLFIGRTGHGSKKRRPYSFLRIDVEEGNPARFIIRPMVVEYLNHQWHNYAAEEFVIS